MNPFTRITYTEIERDRSKEVWKMFYDFWEALYSLTPESPEKTLVLRKLQEANYFWELAHTEFCKRERNKQTEETN